MICFVQNRSLKITRPANATFRMEGSLEQRKEKRPNFCLKKREIEANKKIEATCSSFAFQA
jgi:hypothetical protein